MTAERMAQVSDLILQLADTAYEIAKEIGYGFEIKTSIAPAVYPYPPGTAAVTMKISPGYEYCHGYDGREWLRFKQMDIKPEQIRPGEKPAEYSIAFDLEARK